ncbi:8151_t:CDS:1, partial [Funneliformis caledonium]
NSHNDNHKITVYSPLFTVFDNIRKPLIAKENDTYKSCKILFASDQIT